MTSAEQPDFILFGATGFLGSAILAALEKSSYKVLSTGVRLQNRPEIDHLFDTSPPSLGVICAAGERGRPNISWCNHHPVETVDANITGQLNVAASAYARGLHVTLLGTGSLYDADPADPNKTFSEADPPNAVNAGVYVALRRSMEELMNYFDNVLTLRVLFPVSSDLDARGLLGKLLRFERVDRVEVSVTILEDLCDLIPQLVKKGLTGPLNFTNPGVVSYAAILELFRSRAPQGSKLAQLSDSPPKRTAPRLDVKKLCEAVDSPPPDATESVRRILSAFGPQDIAAVLGSRSPL